MDQLLVMDLTEIICKLQGNTSSYFWLFVTLLSLFVKGLSKLLQAMLLD